MHIEIPDDLTRRLDRCAQEDPETQVALEEQSAKYLDGWTEEALQAAIQEGIDDLAQGQYTDYDDANLLQSFETVKNAPESACRL